MVIFIRLFLFDRKMSRKLMGGLYWETKQRIIDLKLRKVTSKCEEKEIRNGLELTRKIMRHLLDLEGGKRR